MARAKPPLRIEPLTEQHGVEAFDAGSRQPALTAFLHDEALYEQSLGLARVWVALGPDDAIAGYFTLNPITVHFSDSIIRALGLPRTTPTAIAGYLLGQVGIDRTWLGRGLGDALDGRAIEMAERLSVESGAAFVAVDARDDALVEWYTQLGFARLAPESQRLVRALH